MAATSKVRAGADRVCAGGEVVNGICTYKLVLTAYNAGVPVYVLSEMFNFCP
jgi:methylthioribose-1-phosphate isomerase